ncbi:MAG: ATP-binding protein [Lysobacterales bacterium]|nr:sensor histidine kinase N-terminal domain-containing protein [Xanthomonadales bacterium]MCP5474866.1 sensor histidine kinase N-terminal domain-containing protein [Rhodanobacteraceae bacterium]
MRSLRRLLLVALLLTIGVAAAISTLLSYAASRNEAKELFDAKLAQSARVLQALVGHRLDQMQAQTKAVVVSVPELDIEGDGDDLATDDGHAYETKLAFLVYAENGARLLQSNNAPAEFSKPERPGFARQRLGDTIWRTFALHRAGGRWYLVAERDDIRSELAAEIAVGTALPPLLALPIIAVLIVLVVNRATRFIARVADEVEARPADQLHPIDVKAAPQELTGLIQSINRLFLRVQATLEHEKRFTADAAHELRTPISAIKLHAQNLAEGKDQAARDASSRGLRAGIDRCERLVSQLLELARLERGALKLEAQSLDLGAVIRQVIADLAPEAHRRNIELAFSGDSSCLVSGDPVLLAVLARNLIENAIRHGPAEAAVDIALQRERASVLLLVEDQGPGIDQRQRELVFHRFHREPDATGPGSGIGLSIVRRVAELHKASIELGEGSGGKGLRVQVRFPVAREA